MVGPVARYRMWKERRRIRQDARNLRRWVQRVRHLREDLLSLEDRKELAEALVELRQNARRPPEELRGRVRQLLHRSGGKLFPARTLAENAEAFLTAAILALTIRVFFLQLFSIPTNSMWPSYKGMTAEYPAAVGRAPVGNFFCGATPYDLISPESGPILIPINDSRQVQKQRSFLPYSDVRGWRWGIWPTRLRRYELLVGGKSVFINVPREFDMEQLLMRRFFPSVDSHRIVDAITQRGSEIRRGRRLLSTGQHTGKSEAFLSFEIIHGDVLLVDRLTPHFFPPRRGGTVVFATRSVPSLQDKDDRYYIKRMVATGGDEVAVQNGKLLVNGAEANFSPAMEKNNRQQAPFNGYQPLGSLSSGPARVPDGHGFVMGDNSSYSYDSRYFGAIPLRAIIGRPRMHLYPLVAAQDNVPKTKRSSGKARPFFHFWNRYARGE
ncbi:MAG: signal peptidase I [Puniceicoccales bacterium]|jgi:signal peptidase I|nr:signal peptidase I [Puniceicoccales bacterium]